MNPIGAIRQLTVDAAAVLLSRRKPRTAAVGARRRVTFVQFGDYAEDYWRLQRGGTENYYAQKYSVDFVGSLAARPDVESVTVICVAAAAAPAELPNGVRTVGIELYSKAGEPRYAELLEQVRATRPSHLLARTPCIPLIAWGVRNGCQVLPMLADSFRAKGLKAFIEYRLLGLLFGCRAIEFVANHNLAASLDLRRIGIPAQKVIPYDWPALISPRDFPAKSAPPASADFRLLYVGAVIESKGVGEAIAAVGLLRNRGVKVTLTIIGRGDVEVFKDMALRRGLREFVNFPGPQSHSGVVKAMRGHDAVVVPSHWSYPEGLPMTLYEALCARTPLLTSDHPMFALKIRDGYNALVFAERDAAAFAQRIEELVRSPELYSRLSVNALAAADAYLCPLKFDQLISGFLGLAPSIDLPGFSLASGYANYLKS
ncbi:MAG TPA: glycosyltransferase [Steroidobacteraceae bacterium]|nr:glycosyltransferase [Steroidobacteraceae bacterium]